jgi:hypothetical protein
VRLALPRRARGGNHDAVEQVDENCQPIEFKIGDSQKEIAHQDNQQEREKARPEGN